MSYVKPGLHEQVSVISLGIVSTVHSDTANHGSRLFKLEKWMFMIGCDGVDDTEDVQ